MIVIVL